jgi:hypothetical protein
VIWTYYAQGEPPALPDWSVLADMSPPVALALLGTVLVVTVLFHFGGVIRERLSRKSEPAKPVELPSTASPASALPQAVDSASNAYQSFIDHLRGQLAAQEQEHAQEQAQLALERDQARREASDLRVEVQQLRQMLWQRGTQ